MTMIRISDMIWASTFTKDLPMKLQVSLPIPKSLRALAGAALAFATLASPLAHAQEAVLNLYSARHYQTDEALYANFTKATGKIGRASCRERV